MPNNQKMIDPYAIDFPDDDDPYDGFDNEPITKGQQFIQQPLQRGLNQYEQPLKNLVAILISTLKTKRRILKICLESSNLAMKVRRLIRFLQPQKFCPKQISILREQNMEKYANYNVRIQFF